MFKYEFLLYQRSGFALHQRPSYLLYYNYAAPNYILPFTGDGIYDDFWKIEQKISYYFILNQP